MPMMDPNTGNELVNVFVSPDTTDREARLHSLQDAARLSQNRA